MEKEFLLGIDFGLYVDKSTYDSWLNLLQGLVMAKERELQHWRRSRRPARSLHRVQPLRHSSSNLSRPQPTTRVHRARSTSPRRCPAVLQPSYAPSPYAQYPGYHPKQAVAAPSSTKRTASEAFSNDSSPYVPPAPMSEPPRRSAGLTLQIPELEYSSSHSSESSASPLEPLQGFSKLSLGASPVDVAHGSPWAATIGQNEVPQTLVSAYCRDERRLHTTPQVSRLQTCTAYQGLTYVTHIATILYHLGVLARTGRGQHLTQGPAAVPPATSGPSRTRAPRTAAGTASCAIRIRKSVRHAHAATVRLYAAASVRTRAFTGLASGTCCSQLPLRVAQQKGAARTGSHPVSHLRERWPTWVPVLRYECPGPSTLLLRTARSAALMDFVLV